jgi:nitrite reductase/ring-hydroxylating ferredoxin subunit
MKYLACRYETLETSGKLAFSVNNRPVVVVRSSDGSVHALRDVCPHKGPCLSDGMIDRNCLGNEAGEYIYDRTVEVLRCPWHSWEFDIRTGKSLFDPEKVRVKTYPVTVENGDVFVEI